MKRMQPNRHARVAIFFDSQGTLYAYKSGSGGTTGYVYRVFNPNTSNPTSDRLSATLSASNLDGARCPVAPPQGAPALFLYKTTLGSGGGPFGFTINNTAQTSGSATTTAANTPVQVDGDTTTAGTQAFAVKVASIGQALAVQESTLPPGWSVSDIACTSNGTPTGTRSGATITIPGSAVQTGSNLVCTFTNASSTDLSVTKTDTATTATIGAQTTYTITVRNNGPGSATDALVKDTPDAAHLSACALSTQCSVITGTATCPAPGVLTMADLGGAGVPIPSMSANSSIRFAVTCTAQ